MKLCIDCKHHIKSVVYDRCTKFKSVVNPLDPFDVEFCELQRVSNWFIARLLNECGKSGRFWEAKEEKK